MFTITWQGAEDEIHTCMLHQVDCICGSMRAHAAYDVLDGIYQVPISQR